MPKSKKRKEKSLMRFLTRSLLMGKYGKAKELANSAAWTKRREEITSLLPTDVHALMNVELHDAVCRRFERDLVSKSLELTFRGGGLPSGYFDLFLRYEGALLYSRDNGITALLSRSRKDLISAIDLDAIDPLARRAIRSGWAKRAEVYWHEVDIAKDGSFEHRLLLWPYGELLIRFRHLSLTQTPISSWDAP